MALFEPKSFDVQLDPARVRAGESIRGQIVARKPMSVSAFQMVLTQHGANVVLVEVPALRGPNQELIERRPLCALAGPDFDERLIDHRSTPALGRV